MLDVTILGSFKTQLSSSTSYFISFSIDSNLSSEIRDIWGVVKTTDLSSIYFSSGVTEISSVCSAVVV